MTTILKYGMKDTTYTIILLILFAVSTQAATFTVTKIADTNDGVCDSDCSLREAIDEANTAATDDIIEFASPLFDTAQTITLSGSQLLINGNNGSLTINGTGAKLLTIDANSPLSGNSVRSVFQINPNEVVTLNDITITGGGGTVIGSFGNNGGGIHNRGNLTINRSIIDGNILAGGQGSLGGGIFNSGTINVNDSTISNNTTPLVINNFGGGMLNQGGTANIVNSTISGNTSAQGGGVTNQGGQMTFTNSTVSNNNGGGIHRRLSGTLNIKNTIVANNNSRDIEGTITSQGYNLIGKTNGGTITATTGDQFGTNANPIDPMLGALADNGGDTQTHALLFGSPAIDTGDPTTFEPTDQRGTSRPLDGDGNGTTRSDIGAVERDRTFIVTKIADTDDGVCDSDCSLREAIDEANTAATDDIIEFASPLFDTAQTITLGGTQLQISGTNDSLTINGTGAKILTIDGNAQSRVFRAAGDADRTINDLTITNGRHLGGGNGGGGILSESNLTLNNVVVDNNHSVNTAKGGGGIYAKSRILNVNNSTISNNSAFFSPNNSLTGVFEMHGGGIRKDSATVTVTNSTISGNSAPIGGGIISSRSTGSVTVINSTIVNNSATQGAGITQFGAPFRLKNTIVANNTAPSRPNINGIIISQGYNLIENTAGGTINGNTTGNITGQDPMLGVLADYGGPTPTHRLLAGSPAIDAADPADFLQFDQRGFVRPANGNPLALKRGTSKLALGFVADIGAFEALAPTASAVSIAGRVVTNGKGRAIPNVTIQISNSGGIIQTVRSNHFGRFRFTGIEAGETYIFTIQSKGYQFAPQVINVSESVSDLVFTPN